MLSKSGLKALKNYIATTLLLCLMACSEESSTSQALHAPVAFQAGDECHVCGMIITGFPGPKGEVIESKSGAVRKFCSTRDMLGWWLQPEYQHLQAALYVHDMAATDWRQPDDRHLIDARSAYFVVGTPLQGSMGRTLATYKTLEAAQKLVDEKGGRVLRFEEITLELLNQLIDMPHP